MASLSLPVLADTLPLPGGGQGGGHFASYILAPAQQSGSLTFTPVADAYLSSGSPSNNHGSSTTLQIDKSPDMHFLLKFTVTGVNGQAVTNAKIRLYNVNGSVKGGDYYRVSDNSWQEGTVTWNNAPAADATPLATLGSVSVNTWVEVDVTSLIAGDGTYSLRARSRPPPPMVRITLPRKAPTRRREPPRQAAQNFQPLWWNIKLLYN